MPWKQERNLKKKKKLLMAAEKKNITKIQKTNKGKWIFRYANLTPAALAPLPPSHTTNSLFWPVTFYVSLSIIDYWLHLPMKSNASWKYCLIFWWGVSLAGICIYFRPCRWLSLGLWQVTFNTQLAPTLLGSSASRPLPNSRCGNTGEAGCVSISAKEIDQFID